MATVVTIGGSVVNLPLYNVRAALNLRYQTGYSTLTLERRGGPLPGLPDPWLGKTVTLAIGGTTYFAGDVAHMVPNWTGIGWVPTYTCRCLKARCDRVPFTDANTQTDTAAYNLAADDPMVILSRQGRTTGQILSDVLTMLTNATALNSLGVGAYTSLSPPTLPSATVADLAALTVIPPAQTYVQGERLIMALEAFVRFWCPNHILWIQPSDGAIRILDRRTFSASTLTLGTDPIAPTPLARSVGECFQRVVVRGQPIAEPKLVSTSLGTLQEDFAWGPYTNAQAKAAWNPNQTLQDQTAKCQGTCACIDTLNVTITPASGTPAWVSNFWDQTATGHMGWIALTYSVGSGIDLTVSRRIVSNGSYSGSGTCNVQVDLALPATNYDKFQIYGISNGAGLVYKKYKIADATIGAAMARQFTYPQPWVGANGDMAVMTSYPMGSVCYSASGNPPYQEWTDSFTQDPTSSHIYYLTPTYTQCGGHQPSDVRALLAVNTGNLKATYPADVAGVPQYAGTSHASEGLSNTLTVTVGQWRDPINQSAMAAYASDLLDSVKDAIVEGTIVYHGYYATALTPGAALSVTGSGYTTGWESLSLPILETELRWNCGTQTQFTTIMQVSNRRAHFSSAAFLKPDRMVGGPVVGQGLGWLGWQLAGGYQQAMAGVSGFAGMGMADRYMASQDQSWANGLDMDSMLGRTESGTDYRPRRRDRGLVGPPSSAAGKSPEELKTIRELNAMDRRRDEEAVRKDQLENARRAANPEKRALATADREAERKLIAMDQAENARRAALAEKRDRERRNDPDARAQTFFDKLAKGFDESGGDGS